MSLKLRKLLHYNHIKNSISEFVPWVQARSLQSCPTLCDPIDYSPPGSSIHWILQARILEWFAMPSSRGSSRPRDWTCVSYVYLHWQAGSIPLAPPGKPLFPALFSTVFSVTKSYSSLLPHELQHGRLPSPSVSHRVSSDPYLLSRWCHPTISFPISPSPAFNLSQHQGLFQLISSPHQVAQGLQLQL